MKSSAHSQNPGKNKLLQSQFVMTCMFPFRSGIKTVLCLQLPFYMEKQAANTPLQLKLSLLKSLREGNIDQSQQLLAQLASKTRTHPQLYKQFHEFVTQHKAQIKKMDEDEKEQQTKVVCVDEDGSDGSWVTDDSVDLSSDGESEEEEEEEVRRPSRVIKTLANSKSAILLKPVKEVKRPFYVQTKPKQNIASSTINLRRSSPSSKLLTESTNYASVGHPLNPFAKPSSKKSNKPYFPPIGSSKPTLKL